MSISVFQAAKYLGKASDWRLSHLEMQKIIYLCHMMYLGEKDKPLVDEDFQAWDYGPVHPSLYRRLRRSGSSPIDKSIFNETEDLIEDIHKEEIEMLNRAIKRFPPGSGPKLLAITHWEKGAWAKRYKAGVKNIIISKDDILEEYTKRQEEFQ